MARFPVQCPNEEEKKKVTSWLQSPGADVMLKLQPQGRPNREMQRHNVYSLILNPGTSPTSAGTSFPPMLPRQLSFGVESASIAHN